MSVPPIIPTESVTAYDQVVGQSLDGLSLNPTDANLKTAGVAVLLIAGMGILLAVRNPKFALGIMTGTLGASMLAAYVALNAPSTTPALAANTSSSSSS